ncbi:MAG: hypothetical protein EB127_13795 [Alphaproteobacteria bacterium]|nr:hypothetical protein [Alphaproteobacteria bacterium]
MQRLITFAIIIWIVYYIINIKLLQYNNVQNNSASHDNTKISSTNNLVSQSQPKPAQTKSQEIKPAEETNESSGKTEAQVQAPEPAQEPDAKYNYKIAPQSTIERVVTNAVTNVLTSESGLKIAERLVGRQAENVKIGSVAISTNNALAAKLSYYPFFLFSNNEKKSICGQKISLKYSKLNNEDQYEHHSSHTYKIGKSGSRDLDILADGLRLEEKVRIKIKPSSMLDNQVEAHHKNTPSIYEICVTEHLEDSALDTKRISIFDEYINTKSWVVCGDKINLSYLIKDIKGKILKKDELIFDTGDDNYPEILSYAVSFAPFQGKRTILTPIKYLKSSKHPLLNEGDDEEYGIMEIEKINLIPDPLKNIQ